MHSLIVESTGNNAPKTRGEIRVVQQLPGRIGLRSSALKHAKSFAKDVKQALEMLPGMKEVDINTLTGSMLINYDIEQFGEAQCKLMLEKLGQFFPKSQVEKIVACFKRPAAN